MSGYSSRNFSCQCSIISFQRASRTFLSSVSIAALASSMKSATILSNSSWLKLGVGIVELGLADLGDHAVDELDLLLVLVVRKLDGLVHRVVVDFVRAGLDHDDLLAGGDDRDVEIADLALLGVGVEHEFAVHKADLERADRAVPGNVGDGERGGGADESGDLGRAVMIDRHDGRHDGDVVAEIVGEERDGWGGR